jgi:hypothetical protein
MTSHGIEVLFHREVLRHPVPGFSRWNRGLLGEVTRLNSRPPGKLVQPRAFLSLAFLFGSGHS